MRFDLCLSDSAFSYCISFLFSKNKTLKTKLDLAKAITARDRAKHRLLEDQKELTVLLSTLQQESEARELEELKETSYKNRDRLLDSLIELMNQILAHKKNSVASLELSHILKPAQFDIQSLLQSPLQSNANFKSVSIEITNLINRIVSCVLETINFPFGNLLLLQQGLNKSINEKINVLYALKVEGGIASDSALQTLFEHQCFVKDETSTVSILFISLVAPESLNHTSPSDPPSGKELPRRHPRNP